MAIEVNGCARCPLRSRADGAPWCLGVRTKRFPNGRELLPSALHPERPIAPQWCPAEDGLVVLLRRSPTEGGVVVVLPEGPS